MVKNTVKYYYFLRYLKKRPKTDFISSEYAQSFIYNISEISGGLFLEFFLWHDMTKRVMLFHSVPISFLNSSPLKEKMIFSIRFIHPMQKFVFMPFTAVFQEKFHAWYQMKGNDMVYHLRRAQA